MEQMNSKKSEARARICLCRWKSTLSKERTTRSALDLLNGAAAMKTLPPILPIDCSGSPYKP